MFNTVQLIGLVLNVPKQSQMSKFSPQPTGLRRKLQTEQILTFGIVWERLEQVQ